MHHTYSIISFLGISIFVGFILQESREDLQIIEKKLLSGLILGTYISTIVISILIYIKHIPI